MKIVFQCVGFATNPAFLYLDDETPLPYGTVIDRHDELEYWQENYKPDIVSEDDVLNEYRIQDSNGVKIFDVSKEAWINHRFGQEIKR